jgi:esterase/lipase
MTARPQPRRPADGDGATERLTFSGATGAQLAGVLHVPDTTPRGSVLFAHCFTCSKDLHISTLLARSLTAAGYAVLRFDFTGIGDSGGDFADKTVTNNVKDLVAAAHILIRRRYGPCAMVGHSLGGAATLLAARQVKTARSVAVIGAPASPGHMERLIADVGPDIRRQGTATVVIGGRAFPISTTFLDDLEVHDEAGHVAALGRPLLVVHAVDDEVVDVAEGERIFASAAQPKAFMPLLGADHLVSDRTVARRLAAIIVGWLDATL